MKVYSGLKKNLGSSRWCEGDLGLKPGYVPASTLPTVHREKRDDRCPFSCRSSQYSMVAGAGRENGMETPMHENPEWEKARQALASISKAGAAGSSTKASSNGPVASAQVRRHTVPG